MGYIHSCHTQTQTQLTNKMTKNRNTGSESSASSSYRSRVPSCEDGLLKLSDECHHPDHLLPQHDGVGIEWDPLPDHALALLLYPPLRGQPEEGEAQVPELQDSPGEVQQ